MRQKYHLSLKEMCRKLFLKAKVSLHLFFNQAMQTSSGFIYYQSCAISFMEIYMLSVFAIYYNQWCSSHVQIIVRHS